MTAGGSHQQMPLIYRTFTFIMDRRLPLKMTSSLTPPIPTINSSPPRTHSKQVSPSYSHPHLNVLLAAMAEPGPLRNLDNCWKEAAHVVGVVASVAEQDALLRLALAAG